MQWLRNMFLKSEKVPQMDSPSLQKISLNNPPTRGEGKKEESRVLPRGGNMDIRRVRTCERCKAVVPLERVRLYPREKGKDVNVLVCDTCCNELKQTVKQGPPKAPIKNIPPAQPKLYRCNRCNYSFRVDQAKVGLLHRLACPYCGKDDRLEK